MWLVKKTLNFSTNNREMDKKCLWNGYENIIQTCKIHQPKTKATYTYIHTSSQHIYIPDTPHLHACKQATLSH